MSYKKLNELVYSYVDFILQIPCIIYSVDVKLVTILREAFGHEMVYD